ncbi:hypothetical protein P4O66_004330, partial [Electrophorus voltai]
YYVQEMFDPVRVTHFSEGSSILEDTTDSDRDISEREVEPKDMNVNERDKCIEDLEAMIAR